MNNIAALAITMPIALSVARDHRLPPGAVLMPLAFATILGGITTLIGTPANLIISSVREDRVGAPFGMFDMTPTAGVAAAIGLVYLMVIGWRLAPHRAEGAEAKVAPSVVVFELSLPMAAVQGRMRLAGMRRDLRKAGAALLAVIRDGERASLDKDALLFADDRLLVMSREYPWEVAKRTGLFAGIAAERAGSVTAHVSVVHGSSLIGQDYGAIEARTDGAVEFIAAGPRPARLKRPLDTNLIEAGDQLYLRGDAEAVGRLIRQARLLEVGRQAAPVRAGWPAALVIAIYGIAVLLSAALGVATTAAFIAAALAICLLRLLPADEAYRAIDIPVLVLLAGMIPVGRAFNEAGGSDAIAGAMGWALSGSPLFLVLLVILTATMLLSVFLNNVATALVMAQVGIEAAAALGIDPDAALLAVLIGASCDFLTPIGHQNNMIVMRPGNYRFMDYPKVGAPMSLIVVLTSAFVLSLAYG